MLENLSASITTPLDQIQKKFVEKRDLPNHGQTCGHRFGVRGPSSVWAMSRVVHTNKLCHVWRIHVTNMNESFHTRLAAAPYHIALEGALFMMMMIACNTWNSNLVPLIEAQCSSKPYSLRFIFKIMLTAHVSGSFFLAFFASLCLDQPHLSGSIFRGARLQLIHKGCLAILFLSFHVAFSGPWPLDRLYTYSETKAARRAHPAEGLRPPLASYHHVILSMHRRSLNAF